MSSNIHCILLKRKVKNIYRIGSALFLLNTQYYNNILLGGSSYATAVPNRLPHQRMNHSYDSYLMPSIATSNFSPVRVTIWESVDRIGLAFHFSFLIYAFHHMQHILCLPPPLPTEMFRSFFLELYHKHPTQINKQQQQQQ